MSSSSRWLIWLFAAIAAVIVVLKGLATYAEYCWFVALGQGPVFAKIFWTRVGLGLTVGLLFFLWLLGNLRKARRPLPEGVVLVGRRLLTDEERQQVEQYLDRALLVFCIIGGLMVGLVASGRWLDWIHFRNPVPFGYTDPLFGLDASFYVFRLNMLMYMWRVIFYAFAVAFVGSVLVYFYQEAIRIVGNAVHVLPHARAHTLMLLAGALLVKAVGYRLDQFRLLFSPRGEVFYGACYADVHGRLPVMWALIALCVVGAVVCIASIRGRRFLWPGGALAVIVLVSVLGGAAYPYLVHKFVVRPNQLAMERPFIANNIQATNLAYGLTDVRNEQHSLTNQLSWADIRRNRATIENIRLWDHRPLEQTYNHKQALRAYYNFSDVDVDRYVVDGRYRQVMLASRQLDYSRIPLPRAWVKTHLKYTHGYGVCASPVNVVGPKGLPVMWVRDIPPVSVPELKIDKPALYYMASLHPRLIELIAQPEQIPQAPRSSPPEMEEVGEEPPKATKSEVARRRPSKSAQVDYVIVNTAEMELDYPRLGEGEGSNALTRYTGRGGAPVSGFFRRLAFAARFMDLQILLTGSIKAESRILMNRYLPDRFFALAPWILYDPDPYIVISDGRLKWMCDAYTVSNRFPYSQPVMRGMANYIRNSIKIVCDAYDGIPEFYVFDPSDPLVRCYQKVFPTLFKPIEEMPSHLRKHIRYPQLLFILQAEIYGDYHMRDPETFYQREDSWSVPREFYSQGPRPVEAYYVIMRLPGEEREEFLLMLPLTLRGREERNMVAWMAARCDPEHYGELVVYQFPKKQLVWGPMQIEYRIDQDAQLSELFTLWGQRGSRVIRGNLLAIPIEDSMLYVEPVYLVATETSPEEEGGLPQLRLVIVALGDKLAFGKDLDEALRKLFGMAPAEVAAEAPPAVEAPAGPPTIVAGDARALVQRAIQLDEEALSLLRKGDLAGYQRKQQEQRQVLEQLKNVLK